MLSFLGTCDRFRKTESGERRWQQMMQANEKISETEFLKACDITGILDPGESWARYKADTTNQSIPMQFFKSVNGLYFFQVAGFEFIWGCKSAPTVRERDVGQAQKAAG